MASSTTRASSRLKAKMSTDQDTPLGGGKDKLSLLLLMSDQEWLDEGCQEAVKMHLSKQGIAVKTRRNLPVGKYLWVALRKEPGSSNLAECDDETLINAFVVDAVVERVRYQTLLDAMSKSAPRKQPLTAMEYLQLALDGSLMGTKLKHCDFRKRALIIEGAPKESDIEGQITKIENKNPELDIEALGSPEETVNYLEQISKVFEERAAAGTLHFKKDMRYKNLVTQMEQVVASSSFSKRSGEGSRADLDGIDLNKEKENAKERTNTPPVPIGKKPTRKTKLAVLEYEKVMDDYDSRLVTFSDPNKKLGMTLASGYMYCKYIGKWLGPLNQVSAVNSNSQAELNGILPGDWVFLGRANDSKLTPIYQDEDKACSWAKDRPLSIVLLRAKAASKEAIGTQSKGSVGEPRTPSGGDNLEKKGVVLDFDKIRHEYDRYFVSFPLVITTKPEEQNNGISINSFEFTAKGLNQPVRKATRVTEVDPNSLAESLGILPGDWVCLGGKHDKNLALLPYEEDMSCFTSLPFSLTLLRSKTANVPKKRKNASFVGATSSGRNQGQERGRPRKQTKATKTSKQEAIASQTSKKVAGLNESSSPKLIVSPTTPSVNGKGGHVRTTAVTAAAQDDTFVIQKSTGRLGSKNVNFLDFEKIQDEYDRHFVTINSKLGAVKKIGMDVAQVDFKAKGLEVAWKNCTRVHNVKRSSLAESSGILTGDFLFLSGKYNNSQLFPLSFEEKDEWSKVRPLSLVLLRSKSQSTSTPPVRQASLPAKDAEVAEVVETTVDKPSNEVAQVAKVVETTVDKPSSEVALSTPPAKQASLPAKAAKGVETAVDKPSSEVALSTSPARQASLPAKAAKAAAKGVETADDKPNSEVALSTPPARQAPAKAAKAAAKGAETAVDKPSSEVALSTPPARQASLPAKAAAKRAETADDKPNSEVASKREYAEKNARDYNNVEKESEDHQSSLSLSVPVVDAVTIGDIHRELQQLKNDSKIQFNGIRVNHTSFSSEMRKELKDTSASLLKLSEMQSNHSKEHKERSEKLERKLLQLQSAQTQEYKARIDSLEVRVTELQRGQEKQTMLLEKLMEHLTSKSSVTPEQPQRLAKRPKLSIPSFGGPRSSPLFVGTSGGSSSESKRRKLNHQPST